MTILFMLAWFGSFAVLAVVGVVRQFRYTDLLARTYPDSEYGRVRLGHTERPAMAWDVVRTIRRTQVEHRDAMPLELQRAREMSLDAFRATIVSMIGGMILIIVVIKVALHANPPDPAVQLILGLLLTGGMILTSTIVAAATRARWPDRLKYVIGAGLTLIATLQVAWILGG